MRKILSYLLVALWCCLAVASVEVASFAQGDPSLRQNLHDKRGELEQQRRRQDILNERERDLATQLNNAQYDLQESRQAYKDTIAQLDTANYRLEKLNNRLDEATAQYQISQAQVRKRLREIYLEGDVGYLVVLLGSQTFTDFLDHAYYLSVIINNDHHLLEKVRLLKAELESKARAARDTVAEIQQMKAAQEERVSRLSSIEQKRSSLLADVKNQRKSIDSYVAELEGSTRELEERLRSTVAARQSYAPPIAPSSGSRSWGTGRYVSPAEGPITSPFGYRVHPIFGTLRFHSGVDIGAYYASPVLAADSGTVIDAGWIGGYGNTVIIDHGGGYSTLYGHCSALYVSYGQTVTKGQQIAAVGSTGNSTGPHLHFEVRINGGPVDPLGFI